MKAILGIIVISLLGSAALAYGLSTEFLFKFDSNSVPTGVTSNSTHIFVTRIGVTDIELLRRAYKSMDDILNEEWQKREENLPYKSPYEALIMASIVEKESAVVEERPLIAGLFVNRLRKKMRLQTDPTVIYGIENYDGNIRFRDLRKDTPYNTYTRRGLPPTPIALPGRAAINAALHPADGEELYFVATGLGDGSHAFSTTKKEHDDAVAEYLRRLRQQRK